MLRTLGYSPRPAFDGLQVKRALLPFFREARETTMAKLSKMAQARRKPKFKVRKYNRCPICGRPRAFLRKFAMCRICFRERALRGEVTGVIKSSW